MPVRLKPMTPRSRVKHSTTEPLCSLYMGVYSNCAECWKKGLSVKIFWEEIRYTETRKVSVWQYDPVVQLSLSQFILKGVGGGWIKKRYSLYPDRSYKFLISKWPLWKQNSYKLVKRYLNPASETVVLIPCSPQYILFTCSPQQTLFTQSSTNFFTQFSTNFVTHSPQQTLYIP